MTGVREGFRAEYSAAFGEYVSSAAGERGLERAYELGRIAVSEGLSTLDLAAIHHEVLSEALALASSAEEHARVARAATEFALESLSTFEMAQRGFREAQETARLEQEHSAKLRALAEAALAIATSQTLDDITALLARYALEIVGARRAATSLGSGDHLQRTETVALRTGRIEHSRHRGEPSLYLAVRDRGAPLRLTRAQLESHPAWTDHGPVEPDSWLAVPLLERSGRNAGLIHLSGKLGGEFTENDEAMLVQLAQIASVAIENARLYQREHEIAQTLQRSLLPPNLPDIPGVAISARFRPAGEGDEVGGDFYDVFEMGRGRWGIAVGDVCGKGASAATVTALARYTLRATALHESDPRHILGVLNEALMRHAPEQRFCTVACAALEPGRARLEIANGGHPPPLLLRAGRVEALGGSGTLLGVLDEPPLAGREVELRSGDTVLFYTDGLIDAHAPRRLLPLEELAAALADCRGLSPPEVAARMEALALEGTEGPPRDDIAILVLLLEDGARSHHVEAAGGVYLDLELPPSAESAATAREALAPLGERLGEEELGSVRLLVTELITNSVKHGDAGEAPLRVKAVLAPTHLRVEVTDSGEGFEPPAPPKDPVDSASGWGLYLVNSLADRWGVDTERGTTVWFEKDRLPV